MRSRSMIPRAAPIATLRVSFRLMARMLAAASSASSCLETIASNCAFRESRVSGSSSSSLSNHAAASGIFSKRLVAKRLVEKT